MRMKYIYKMKSGAYLNQPQLGQVLQIIYIQARVVVLVMIKKEIVSQ